jgi:integrase
LIITTQHWTPFEPRNFNRKFTARCRKPGVRYIKPHGMRRTCASLLAALGGRGAILPGCPLTVRDRR